MERERVIQLADRYEVGKNGMNAGMTGMIAKKLFLEALTTDNNKHL